MKTSQFELALKASYIRFSLGVRRLVSGEDHPRVVRLLKDLATIYRIQGHHERAAATFAQAVAIARRNGRTTAANDVAMQQVVDGVRRFQNEVFPKERKLFERLAFGQHPEVLFITCSDSRIDTYHITQMEPGELFVLRNAGNIVPAWTGQTSTPAALSGGEEASIEFAINAIGIKHIIVCGHSHCGAMRGLLDPASLGKMPAVAAWLQHARETTDILTAKHAGLTGEALLQAAVEENVLVQLKHLACHPAVAAKLAAGSISLHGWVYELESGTVSYFDEESGSWRKL